jgi:hypothetical protein
MLAGLWVDRGATEYTMIEARKILCTERLDWDEVSYRIDVRRTYVGYWSTWTCLACDLSGVLPAVRLLNDARVRARSALLTGHHVDAHQLAAQRARPTQHRRAVSEGGRFAELSSSFLAPIRILHRKNLEPRGGETAC